MKEFLLSVIIPIYNAERYLTKCLESILNQTFSAYEVIMIDDGSTDFSSKIAQEYTRLDTRFKYFYQANKGVLSARMIGVKYSQGNYFTFCDADDYYSSKRAFQQLYCILKYEKYDMIQFNHYKKYKHIRLSKGQKRDQIVEGSVFRSRDYPKLLCSFWDQSKLDASVWNKVYSHRMGENIIPLLYEEKVFWGDDMILNLFLLKSCERVYYLSDELYCYRTATGLTNSWRKETMFDLDTIKKYQLQAIEKRPTEEREDYYGMCYLEVAGWFFLHIQQGLSVIDHDEMIQYITNVLELPSFIKAKEYYLIHKDIQHYEVNLLREGDPDKYYRSAVAEQGKRSIKKKIKRIIRKIV